MNRPAIALACLASLNLTACGGGDSPDASTFVDAGRRDTGAFPLDSGVFPDAGVEADSGVPPDSGEEPDTGVPPDSGVPSDSGVEPDSGVLPDSGIEPDAGMVPDAGEPADMGAPDSGPADTGVVPDAGPADTGVVPDAGPADSGVPPDAGGPPVPSYTIDGDLTEWTTPISVLVNPGYNGTGLFGPDNRFEELRVDGDANFLYLGYRFRASGNSAIIHMDTVAGGVTSAAMLDAWPRLMTFPTGADHFVAQYEGGAVQLRDLASPTSAPSSTATYVHSTTSVGVARVTEIAIPWSALGLGAAGPRTVVFFAGVLGGDNYGGGDIAPNANSVPLATGNTIDANNSFTIVFAQGFSVTVP